MRHSANLDILRSFAVSVVLIDHLVRTLAAHTGFHNAAIMAFTSQIGHAGVLAFFVHTSLVLMYSLERLTRTAGRVSLRFYLRRFFRIYPLSIFCVALVLVLHIPSSTWREAIIITPSVILANLLLVQNLFTKTSVTSSLWSLPYEVQMYLVLPALYYLSRRKNSLLYLGGLFAVFCCLGFLIAWKTDHLNMAAYIPCFICGVLCFSLRDRIPASVSSVLWPPFVLLLISCYCLTNLHDGPNFWIGWIFCLLLGLAINAFHDSTNRPLNVVAGKIALYSYGVYLIHLPILYLIFIVFDIKNLFFGPLLFVALTFAVSIVLYHFIESPFIEIGSKLSLRLTRAPGLAPPEQPQEIS
jgi:peptidoglycan/LPS O-acetylase OafA/YrhL